MKYIAIKRCWKMLKATEGKKNQEVIFKGFNDSLTPKRFILKMAS